MKFLTSDNALLADWLTESRSVAIIPALNGKSHSKPRLAHDFSSISKLVTN